MQSLWMVLAALLFSAMGVCVKFSTALYSTSEIVFYRSLFGVLTLGTWCIVTRRNLLTPMLTLHLRRGLIGTASLWLWFYAIGQLPLATAVTLNYTAPIFMAIILTVQARLSAGTQPDWRLLASVGLGFVGVALLLRPSVDSAHLLPGLVGLSTGVLTALAYLQVRSLGRTGEPEWRIVFYFSLTGTAAGLIGTRFDHHGLEVPTWHGGAMLAGVGLFATLAQLALTRAFSRGRTMFTANLQYSGVVFTSLFGIVLFNDFLPLLGWLGMALVVTSGILATVISSLQQRHVTVSAPAVNALPAKETR